MRELDGGAAVEVEHGVQFGRGERQKRLDGAECGVADQEVHVRRGGDGRDPVQGGGVHGECAGLDGMLGTQPIRVLVEQGLPAGDQDEVVPSGGEFLGERGADAVGCAYYQCPAHQRLR